MSEGGENNYDGNNRYAIGRPVSLSNPVVLGHPGPFQIIETEGRGDVDGPIQPPRRRYSCQNYDRCLAVAAALNWDSFTCRGCSGEICENMLWRAHQAIRQDRIAGKICNLPEIRCLQQESPPPLRKVAS